MAIEYRCPECGGTDLRIELMAYVPIKQSTDAAPSVDVTSPGIDIGDYWDGESYAACQNQSCLCCGDYEQLDAHFHSPPKEAP